MPTRALIAKLGKANILQPSDRDLLAAALCNPTRIAAGVDLISEDEEPRFVHYIAVGYACRYKMLPDGDRSIMALLIPGDFCDLHVAILGYMDHSIATLSECEVVRIDPKAIQRLTDEHARINRAFWWATLVDEAVLQEWIVNLGHRSAEKRFAHLICELYRRFEAVGGVERQGFPFPLTQEQIGHALGVTPVYVNRLVQRLRRFGLITLQGRRVTVADPGALEEYADFDGKYLHQTPPSPH